MVRSDNSGICIVSMFGVNCVTFRSGLRKNRYLNALRIPPPAFALMSALKRSTSAVSVYSGRFITVTGCAPP